jgi:hypothetical protein
VPDERVVLEAEITRLQGDNAALKKVLISRKLALPSGIRPDLPIAKVEELRLRLPGRAEFQQAMAFIETVWRRVVAMVAGRAEGPDEEDVTARHCNEVAARRLSAITSAKRPTLSRRADAGRGDAR